MKQKNRKTSSIPCLLAESPSPRVSFSCELKDRQGPHPWVTQDELGHTPLSLQPFECLQKNNAVRPKRGQIKVTMPVKVSMVLRGSCGVHPSGEIGAYRPLSPNTTPICSTVQKQTTKRIEKRYSNTCMRIFTQHSSQYLKGRNNPDVHL